MLQIRNLFQRVNIKFNYILACQYHTSNVDCGYISMDNWTNLSRCGHKNSTSSKFRGSIDTILKVQQYSHEVSSRTREIPDEDNIFGNLNFRSNYEEYIGDEKESKIEAYEKARWQKRESVGYYSNKMKQLCNQGNVQEALMVLYEEMPSVAVHPDDYCYRVLIRACARAGYVKQSFKLYNKMKKEGLVPKPVLYTLLFVACRNSPWPKDGLAHASKLRQQLQEKQIHLNEMHYNAMIRAFGRCGDLETAFYLMDEMIMKKLPLSTDTFNYLLEACISDKETGFRHAIMVWRKLRQACIRPNVYSYNLIVRCASHCKAGDSAVFTNLLHEATTLPKAKFKKQLDHFFKQTKSDAACHVPAKTANADVVVDGGVKKLVIERKAKYEFISVVEKIQDNGKSTVANPGVEKDNYEEDPQKPSTCVFVEQNENVFCETALAQTENGCEVDGCSYFCPPNLLSKQPSRGSVVAISSLETSLERLALLGGSTGVLQQMQNDNLKPDKKLFTQLLTALPASIVAEEVLLKSMESAGVAPDITFCNLLIKRRQYYNNKQSVKDAMALLSTHHLQPDLLTYGCLAVGCSTLTEARKLLADMKAVGARPNVKIMKFLTRNALCQGRLNYALNMMSAMRNFQLDPTEDYIELLEEGRMKAMKITSQLERRGDDLASYELDKLKLNKTFLTQYKKWLQSTRIQRAQEPFQPSTGITKTMSKK